MSIYMASFLSPVDVSIDATVNNDFKARVNGAKCDKYQIIIYNMDNEVQFDTGEISLDTPLYDQQLFSYTLNNSTLTNGIQYKWTLTTWDGEHDALSKETPFYAYSTPTVVMTVPSSITSKKYTFNISYSQLEDVSARKWMMQFYDSNNDLVEETDWSYVLDFQYTFDGFIDGQTYYVKGIVENDSNITTESSLYSFEVDYPTASMSIIPTAQVLDELSAVQICWANLVQYNGVVTGTSDYDSNFLISGNYGLDLDDDSYVSYDVGVPIGFTCIVVYQPDPTFTEGVMVRFEGDNNKYYDIGYSDGRFYFDNSGFIAFGTLKDLPDDEFLIAIRGLDFLIIKDNEIYEWIIL